ncbi:hypothetical protein GCM10010178_79900 [Lentzea flava]|uniref:HTH IS21-type domain-containing protein n=1 Tax=Lentzea flava TaxID=103732 RepID=A0ABQ2VC62_9PSEU|nr:hypothetical protein [Lentzea flava]GGU76723.1 hypothetical protein GCM10010178_79900 [Lentzea flava]
MELYAAIRRDSRAGVSGREIERRYKVGWRTVKQALSSAWPEERKIHPPRGSKVDPFKPAIDVMLREDLRAPREQRHTVKRIFDRLIDEHGMTDVSYGTCVCRGAETADQCGHGPSVGGTCSCRRRIVRGWRPRSTSAR